MAWLAVWLRDMDSDEEAQKQTIGVTKMAYLYMYLRRVEGVTRLNRLRNGDARESLKQEEVMEKVKRKQRVWKEKLE